MNLEELEKRVLIALQYTNKCCNCGGSGENCRTCNYTGSVAAPAEFATEVVYLIKQLRNAEDNLADERAVMGYWRIKMNNAKILNQIKSLVHSAWMSKPGLVLEFVKLTDDIRKKAFLAGVKKANETVPKWTKAEGGGFPEDTALLVTCLEPFFGKFVEEIAVGHYDSDDKRWNDDDNQELIVTHWMPMPVKPKGRRDGIDQKEFFEDDNNKKYRHMLRNK